MMGSHWWVHPVCFAIASWQESGENPVVFCYLIVSGFFTSMRSPELTDTSAPERLRLACWTPSSTFSVPSIAPTAFDN